jgi:hypothetical protein
MDKNQFTGQLYQDIVYDAITFNEEEDYRSVLSAVGRTPVTMTPIELLTKLYDYYNNYADRNTYNNQYFPHDVTSLTKHLKKLEYYLFNNYGIYIEYGRTCKSRYIKFGRSMQKWKWTLITKENLEATDPFIIQCAREYVGQYLGVMKKQNPQRWEHPFEYYICP